MNPLANELTLYLATARDHPPLHPGSSKDFLIIDFALTGALRKEGPALGLGFGHQSRKLFTNQTE